MSTVRKKIVFMDDVNYSLMTVKDRLKGHYEVYIAQTKNKLYEMLDNVKPDLILLDVNMPHCDGFEILEGLKAESDFSDIPVIFLTSQNDKNYVKKAMCLGASDFYLKPFSDAKLIECIEIHLDPEKRDHYRLKVLVVDDCPSILKSVHYILNSQYTVCTLSEPDKLNNVLEDIQPNLFILDYNMPKLTGFDLVPIIRGYQVHATTPIIFLTTEGTVDKILDARCLGASDYIVKPINPDLLREKVAIHMVEHIMWRRVRIR